MIKEKYIKYISRVTIILAVIYLIFSIYYVCSNKVNVNSNNTVETVLNDSSVLKIDIDINKDDWQWLLDNASDEEYRSANITINDETFYNVGIRPKGNSSLSMVARDDTTDRFSFKIDFDQYVDGQTYHGIETLALNNMIGDTTYMKEYLSYDMYKFLGVKTPEYSFGNISINGENWGLYLAIECIDERFLEKNYGTSEGNLYKPETMGAGGGMKDNLDGMPNPNNGDAAPPNMQDNANGAPFNRQDNADFAPPNMEEGNNIMPPDMQGNNNAVPPPNIPTDNGSTKNEKTEGTDNNINTTDNSADNNADANTNNKDAINGRNHGMMNGMGNSNNQGADLKYIDDNISSYSLLRESALFKKTTDKDFENVIKMMKSLSTGEDIDKYLNVEETLKYIAVNTFFVNLDSYSGGMYHNYYLYENNGVCEIIPWDLNLSFAGFTMNDASRAINFPIDNPVTGSLENSPLIGSLLSNDEYKEIYHEYLNKLVSEYVNNGQFETNVNKLDKLINSYVKEDSTAFYSYDEYEKSLPELITFATDRAKSVSEQLNGNQPSTEYGNITTKLNLSALGQQMNGKDKANGMDGNNMPNDMNGKEAFNQNKNNLLDNKGNRADMDKNMQNNNPNNSKFEVVSNSKNWYYLDGVGILALVLIIALLYVSKYKRKRY